MRHRRPPLLLFLLLLLLSGLASACRADLPGAASQELPEPVRYVALGDSIAAGSAATTSYVREYARWFEDETGATVSVTNAAVPGWTSHDLLTAVREDEALRAELAAAHLITFNIGGNDLLAALRALRDGRCGGPGTLRCLDDAVAELVDTWDELLDELLEITDGEVDGLRAMDLYRPRTFATSPPVVTQLERELSAVNDRLARAAGDAGVEVARVHEAFRTATAPRGTSDLLADDGIHPSDHGHAHIAEELATLGTSLNRVG
jgi:lysophospholipase L1-like esterase